MAGQQGVTGSTPRAARGAQLEHSCLPSMAHQCIRMRPAGNHKSTGHQAGPEHAGSYAVRAAPDTNNPQKILMTCVFEPHMHHQGNPSQGCHRQTMTAAVMAASKGCMGNSAACRRPLGQAWAALCKAGACDKPTCLLDGDSSLRLGKYGLLCSLSGSSLGQVLLMPFALQPREVNRLLPCT